MWACMIWKNSKKELNSSFHPIIEENSLNLNLTEESCSSRLAPSMKQVELPIHLFDPQFPSPGSYEQEVLCSNPYNVISSLINIDFYLLGLLQIFKLTREGVKVLI